ncbi:unnamed protein product [Caenorhabditis bovis]|uniref:Receptor ligand binding region domain-containing protein n=1 Tax=Caenorhabditis bovis TaxID=2654633 RepID=A0A8S1F6R8_9PELO|nr:unnamed protein product [Caenorhabditis bovis]
MNPQDVDRQHPIYVIVPLPNNDDFSQGKNPFLLSLPKVKPIIDLAVDKVYKDKLVERGSLVVVYRDTHLSDAHGPNVAVEQYKINQIDCIIGYAYGYALAPVARMSPYWRNGVPVITPIGLTMSLDDKTEYQLMTRINTPYKVVSRAVSTLFKTLKWKRHVFMFHHAKSPSIAVGECFLLMASIQHPLRENFEMQHNFFTFNEDHHANMTWERRQQEWLTVLCAILIADGIVVSPTTTSSSSSPLKTTKRKLPPLTPSQLAHFPFNVIVILPEKESIYDNFRMTLQKAKPVIDTALDDVAKKGFLPPDWINLTYWDSRLYEDISLAERHATVGVIQAYCEHRLDAILGFADNYGLATVTKVTAGLNGGIPILTTSGMPSLLNSKKEYPFLTRMQGSYQLLADSMYQLIAYHEDDLNLSSSNSSLNYIHLLFFYHDKRRAVNRQEDENQETGAISSHCYFSLYAIKRYFTEKSSTFKREWALNTPQFPFDEDQLIGRETFKQWLREISYQSNG